MLKKSSGSYKITPLNGQRQKFPSENSHSAEVAEQQKEVAKEQQKGVAEQPKGVAKEQQKGVAEQPKGVANQPDQQKTAWGCIYMCAVFTFSASVQFTMYITSLWPFMRILDKTVTESFFGLVIAMYSLAQIFASPVIGIWSNRIGKMKPPLIFCNMMMFIGNFVYFVVELFPAEYSRYVLITSRLIAGIGWAQVGLLKSYASAASTTRDRHRATALITGGVAMGVTLGPALQMLFTAADYPGLPICLSSSLCLHISMFTLAPLFASLVNIALMCLLLLWFNESYVGIMEMHTTDKTTENKESADEQQPSLPPYDRVAVCVCCAMRFTQFFIFTNIETIGVAFAMLMFSWSPTQVVFYESIAHSMRGAMTLMVYIAYIVFDLGKKINDRIACLCSLAALMLFHLITFAWPFLPDNVQMFDSSDNSTIVNASTPRGCDMQRMVWCAGMTRVNVWTYYVAMVVLMGIAFPNINVAMNTLFSRIIGPRLQSKQQGMLEMYGGIGRMLGPLLIGFVYLRYGPRAIWLLEGGEIALMMALWLIFYSRLVPLQIPDGLKKNGIRPGYITSDSFTGSVT